MKNNNLKYRVDLLEKNYEKLDNKIDILLTNHLPSLQQEISSLKTKMNVMTAVNVGAIILGVIISKLI